MVPGEAKMRCERSGVRLGRTAQAGGGGVRARALPREWVGRPFRALGWGWVEPKALPWAAVGRAVGAGEAGGGEGRFARTVQAGGGGVGREDEAGAVEVSWPGGLPREWVGRPFRALGWGWGGPKALPWATVGRAVGAGEAGLERGAAPAGAVVSNCVKPAADAAG